MLMYPLSEAIILLAEKLSTAKRTLRHNKEDLEFLREQVSVIALHFVPYVLILQAVTDHCHGGQLCSCP